MTPLGEARSILGVEGTLMSIYRSLEVGPILTEWMLDVIVGVSVSLFRVMCEVR